MNYPPKHHQENEFSNALELIKMFPLATVITSSKNKILSTHIPLVYNKKGTLGTLVGHLDKFNPQISHFEDEEHDLNLFLMALTFISLLQNTAQPNSLLGITSKFI